MKRILFVDDEQDLLDGLRNALRRERKRWELRFAAGGEAALQEMEREPFDVVVSDMRMPGMDGLTFLAMVQQRYPLVVRIVLSGHADLASVVRASTIAHQYLLKPCEPDVVSGVIERALEIQGVLASEHLRNIVGGLGTLPTRPAMYEALTRALGDPAVEVRKLAAIVIQDVGLSARVLQLVNSAYCGLTHRVSSIEAAITLLGLNTLRHLALTSEVFKAFGGQGGHDMEQLERHAALTARIAHRLASGTKEREVAFSAGLLHDAGKLVILSRAPESIRGALLLAEESGLSALAAEREVFGATHAEIGAYLLGLWDLPHTILEPVAYHHAVDRIGRRGLDVVTMVALADLLAYEVASPPGSARQALEAFTGLGDVESWRVMAQEEARTSALP